MLARTFRQMLVILEKNVRDSRAIWQALWQGFRIAAVRGGRPYRQARRYKSRRDLTRALRLIARADLELRSSPPDKRLVLERLVYELASEAKPVSVLWETGAGYRSRVRNVLYFGMPHWAIHPCPQKSRRGQGGIATF